MWVERQVMGAVVAKHIHHSRYQQLVGCLLLDERGKLAQPRLQAQPL
jgi:hypothetical protein